MKRLVLSIVVFILLLLAVGAFMPANNSLPSSNISEDIIESQSTPQQVYKQGDPVEIGHFKYEILSVKQVKYLNDGFSYKKSDGVFWIIKIAVTNISNETRTLDSSMFAIKTDDGVKYEPSNKGMYRNGTLFLKQIQPGLPIKGNVIFEVPSNIKTANVILSGGFGEDNLEIPIALSGNEVYDH